MYKTVFKGVVKGYNVEVKEYVPKLTRYYNSLKNYREKDRNTGLLRVLRRETKKEHPRILEISKKFRKYGMTIKESVPYDNHKSFYSAEDNFLMKLRHIRVRFQRDNVERKVLKLNNGSNVVFRKVGGVFSEEGNILKLLYKTHLSNFYKDKKPKSNRRHVGVELEFCSKMNQDELGMLLYKKGLIKYCTWKIDHSLRPKKGEHGHELAIIATERKIISVVRRICRVLLKNGALAEDRRCGVHVHIDVRNRDKEKVYNNLVSCQRWLMKMAPESRRNSEFCRRVSSRKFPKHFNGSRRERYKTVNAASYFRHKTIEVRLHEGSLDYKSINNWIKLLIKIANHGEKVDKAMPSVKRMVDTFNLNETYVRDRINKWRVLEGGASGLSRAVGMFVSETLTEVGE